MVFRQSFGRNMRDAHFQFAPSYTPLNHGSFGAYPHLVQDQQNAFHKLAQERPDTFIVYDLPTLVDQSREAIAPLLGADVDDVVFVPNASTGVNTVLRNLEWSNGDVVVHFSTIYGACEKTLASIKEHEPLETVSIPLIYPIEDVEIVELFRTAIISLKKTGKHVRLALFDIISTFPGARIPWEKLVAVCKEMEVLSLIDGAHGIGHIDLTHLGKVGPDFFVSNCYKYVEFLNSSLSRSVSTSVAREKLTRSRWLYTPRGCAVFYVPARNQHLIHTSFPTSHGYQYPLQKPSPNTKKPFVLLFEFVATMDYTPWLCVQAALDFRRDICGGEEQIRRYCQNLAREGGSRVAEILETDVMDTKSGLMRECAFVNVKLPIHFDVGMSVVKDGKGKIFPVDMAGIILDWLRLAAVKEFDTYLQIAFHAGYLWVRLSAQIYLELGDFEWIGHRLKELCNKVRERKGIS
jgi:selenocysteine lyase/cysteine desulfurase